MQCMALYAWGLFDQGPRGGGWWDSTEHSAPKSYDYLCTSCLQQTTSDSAGFSIQVGYIYVWLVCHDSLTKLTSHWSCSQPPILVREGSGDCKTISWLCKVGNNVTLTAMNRNYVCIHIHCCYATGCKFVEW